MPPFKTTFARQLSNYSTRDGFHLNIEKKSDVIIISKLIKVLLYFQIFSFNIWLQFPEKKKGKLIMLYILTTMNHRDIEFAQKVSKFKSD